MEAEITGINGRELRIVTQGGTQWKKPYIMHDELSLEIISELERRQREGWKTLGIAKFESQGNLLILVDVGM